MYYTKQILRVVCRRLLLLLGLVSVTSCITDDEYGRAGMDTITMQLNLTAREEGDLNSRASEVGTNSEYMHNLCVFLVQNGTVIKKFYPDLSSNPLAKDGNLRIWLSEPFQIDIGDYTVYAFANIASCYSEEWGNLIGLKEGETMPDIDEIVLQDPVSKIDFKNSFIPMSAKQTVTVTSETKAVSIALDRLVSKIRASVTGKAGAKVTGFSFEGYADRIALFSDNNNPEDVHYDRKKVISMSGDGTLVADGSAETGQLAIPDFYVNSSPSGNPFQVEIVTDEKGGTVYRAVTHRDDLPRNSIFPLKLQLNYSDFNLDATCWVSPIGSFPVEVNVGFSPDTYEIKVPEGCQFVFEVSVAGGANVSDLSTTWNILHPVTGIDFDGATSGGTTLKGHVTATVGKQFDLQLVATWKNGDASYHRTYTVKLITADLADFSFKTQGRSVNSNFDYLKPERLCMFK